MASRARQMSVPCGSPRYLAPEVLSGKYGQARDLWSCGIVAHELLFDQHPFGHMSDDEILDSIVCPEPVTLPADVDEGKPVPTASRALVAALLLKDPCQRLTAAEAVS